MTLTPGRLAELRVIRESSEKIGWTWLVELLDEIEALRAENERLREVMRRPMEDSVVTTSDNPGCFFCDRAGEHAKDCEAKAALARREASDDEV